MPLRFCSQPDCSLPADRGQGTCVPCRSHLCSKHLYAERHGCPKLMSTDPDSYYEQYDENLRICHQELVDRIDLAALQKVASELHGSPCSLPGLAGGNQLREVLAKQMGGQNCHIDITFDDGVTWIARLRLNNPIQAPDVIRDYVVRSEVATLYFTEELPIPTPRVHHFTLSTSVDEVGVPYVLMDKLEGHLLDFDSATEDQKRKVLTQLAQHSLALRAHPFPKAGSLILGQDGKKLEIGPYAVWQLWSDSLHSLGPYETVRGAYRDILRMYLEFCSTGELDNLALDNTLALSWRLRFLNQWHLTSQDKSIMFYLKHQDDKGDHILVNDDFEITGIIDWETATLEPEEVAFSSPLMLWPVGDFYDGKNDLTGEELELARIFTEQGEDRMAQLVIGGRLYQRFLFFLGSGSDTREEFIGLFDGLRTAATGTDLSTESDGWAGMLDYEEWKKVEIEEAEPLIKEIMDQIKQRNSDRDLA